MSASRSRRSGATAQRSAKASRIASASTSDRSSSSSRREGRGGRHVEAEHRGAGPGRGHRGGRSARSAARSMRSVTGTSASASPTGSIRNSGVPASTCTFRATKTSRTRPPTGAEMAISIFIASTTARRAPASTTSSGATSTPTTSAAAGARTMPASSRENRWATPSTSIRWSLPWVEDTTLKLRPPIVRRLRPRPMRSTSTTAVDAVELDLVPGRPDAPDRDPAGLPAVAELDLAADLGVGVRSAAARPAEERGPVERRLELAGVEGGGDEGDVGQAGGQVLVGGGEPVEPRRCRPRRPAPRGARAGRAGTTCSWCRRRTSTVVCDSARCRRASASSRCGRGR